MIREADVAVRQGQSVTELRQHLHRIRRVMAEVADVQVPLSYQERLQKEIELTSAMVSDPII